MPEQGCSDGNCRLRLTPVTGQHTNAGCRCLRGVPVATRIAISRKLDHQLNEIERLRGEREVWDADMRYWRDKAMELLDAAEAAGKEE